MGSTRRQAPTRSTRPPLPLAERPLEAGEEASLDDGPSCAATVDPSGDEAPQVSVWDRSASSVSVSVRSAGVSLWVRVRPTSSPPSSTVSPSSGRSGASALEAAPSSDPALDGSGDATVVSSGPGAGSVASLAGSGAGSLRCLRRPGRPSVGRRLGRLVCGLQLDHSFDHGPEHLLRRTRVPEKFATLIPGVGEGFLRQRVDVLVHVGVVHFFHREVVKRNESRETRGRHEKRRLRSPAVRPEKRLRDERCSHRSPRQEICPFRCGALSLTVPTLLIRAQVGNIVPPVRRKSEILGILERMRSSPLDRVVP
jgi:hypothetical protein